MNNVKSVMKEVRQAYADCWMGWEKAKNIRNLHFRASSSVSRNDAIEILESCVGGYNNFCPSLLKKFPENACIVIAREGSVCLYVNASRYPSAACVNADEKDEDSSYVRYWWD